MTLTPSPSRADALRLSLARRVRERASHGALHHPELLPGLKLFRSDHTYSGMCGAYEPSVALILQGSKRLSLGSDTLVYGPDRYLITAMDLPVTAAVLEASPERPYLGLALRLDVRELATLMLDTPAPAAAPAVEARAMGTGALSEPLLDAFDRLLALLDHPVDAPALAPLIVREIHYRLLTGDAGARLRQMATAGSQSQQIARAIARLNRGFAEPLRVEDLAREAHMSPSTFHTHFKALTAMSPLQYQKQLRLAEARRLMLAEQLEASTAAYRVGYESPSQFSREYARQFGAPPSRDIGAMRERQRAA